MLPMISSLQEFRQALALIDTARAELAREKKKVGRTSRSVR